MRFIRYEKNSEGDWVAVFDCGPDNSASGGWNQDAMEYRIEHYGQSGLRSEEQMNYDSTADRVILQELKRRNK